MLNKTQAIVLHHVKYGESSLIVHFYSEKFGRLACIVSGVRSKKKLFPQNYFQPLTILEIDLYFKQNRDLHRLKELTNLVYFNSIPFNIKKTCIAIFIAEILYKTLREEESNTGLYDFLKNSIQILDIKNEGIETFHLAFLLQFTKYLGIYPSGLINPVNELHNTDLHLFADLPNTSAEILQKLLTISLTKIDEIKMDNFMRALLLDKIIQYYNQHLEGMAKVKSLMVLKEVFS